MFDGLHLDQVHLTYRAKISPFIDIHVSKRLEEVVVIHGHVGVWAFNTGSGTPQVRCWGRNLICKAR